MVTVVKFTDPIALWGNLVDHRQKHGCDVHCDDDPETRTVGFSCTCEAKWEIAMNDVMKAYFGRYNKTEQIQHFLRHFKDDRRTILEAAFSPPTIWERIGGD